MLLSASLISSLKGGRISSIFNIVPFIFMSEDIDFWIRQSQGLIERIRVKFVQYQKEGNKCKEINEELNQKLKDKIQNQWRKLHDLITKEIPEKAKGTSDQQYRNLNNIREVAIKIYNQFIDRFGYLRYLELKNRSDKGLWKGDVFHSGIRKLGKSSEQLPLVRQSPVKEEQNEEDGQEISRPTASQIFRSEYQNDDEPSMEKLHYDLRKSMRESEEVQKYKSFNSRLSGFFILSLLLLLAVIFSIGYFQVEVDSGLIKYLLDL